MGRPRRGKSKKERRYLRSSKIVERPKVDGKPEDADNNSNLMCNGIVCGEAALGVNRTALVRLAYCLQL